MILLAALLIAGTPDFVEVRAELACETGDAYLDQNLLEEAESEFRDALELLPGYPDALLGLGMVYSRRGSWETAERYLAEYVDSMPSSAQGLMELASVLNSTGRSPDACGYARRATESSPDDPACWLLAGRTLLLAGDTTASAVSLGRGMVLGGVEAIEAATLLADIHLARGEEEPARILLQQAWDAGYADAGWRLGRLFISWGDYLRGEALVRAALAADPAGAFADSAHILLESLSESGLYLPPGVQD